MRKIFLLIPVLALSLITMATPPTITIDGDKSDWAEIPMLSEPGTWPVLKVIPAADAELGTNALVYMMENIADFDPTWNQYPQAYIDKDYDGATSTLSSYWAFDAMGLEYQATTGIQVGEDWVDFPKAMSDNNKVFEIGFPTTYVTDLGSKFAFAMYYNSGAWFCPDRSEPAVQAFSPKNGFLYKTRSFTTVAGTTNLTTANVYAHPSMGEVGAYVDFGLRDNGYDTIRWAAFPIELTKAGKYDVTANVTSTNGWKFEFWVVDVATNAIVAHLDAPVSDVSSSETSYSFGTLDLSAVPTGKYMLKVKNRTAYSKVKLNSIDLTYAGGAIVNIPATLEPEDAILSSLANIKPGTVDSILFTAEGSYCNNATEWAKWKVNVTKAGVYNFTAYTYRKSGSMKFEIAVLNSDESSTLISNDNGGSSIGSSGNASISSGDVELAVGTYIVKVRDIYVCADSRLLNVVAEYKGGAIVDIPATLLPEDVILSDEAWVDKTGAVDSILFTARGSEGHNSINWAKWKVNVTKAGMYNFTANVCRPGGGQKYEIAVLNSDESSTLISFDNGGSSIASGDKSISTGIVNLAVGTYIIRVRNIYDYAESRLLNVVAAYSGGAVIDVPGQLVGEEAVICKEGGGTLKMYHLANGNLQYNDNGTPLGEYAYWNINATEAGDMKVTLNVVAPEVGDASGHQFLVELYSDLNASPIASSAEASQTSATGARELPDVINIPATGSYIIKLTNQTQWSSAILHSITFAAVPVLSNVTIDDAATDNSVWSANVGGAAVNVELTRTFVGGMYNTISLPFAVSDEKVIAAFGAGVELMYMTGATLDGTVLDLEFAPTTDIYQGTPYLIKPTADVVNPQFAGVEFVLSEAVGSATGGTNADFIGTFVKQTIPGNPNNLYLQSGNVLKFSDNDVTIKGTRAYFHVKGLGSALPVVKPRIVMNGQVLTDIELINGEPQVNGKFIENGQLIIIRDGVRYNALGVRVK